MIEANVRNITPEMAFELLTKNTKNYRRVDPRTVKYYAREMAEGRWQMNGEPIQFAEDGTLLNGQHRLTAIVESGITVPMLVVTGLKKDVVTYDEGKLRSAVDVAHNMGVDVGQCEIAVANLMIADTGFVYRGAKDATVAKIEAVKYAGEHVNALKTAWSCVRGGGGHNPTGILLKRAWAATAVYLLIRDGNNVATVSDFCEVVNSGLPIPERECSPALIIRNMFFGQVSLVRHSDKYDNMHYFMLAFGDFKCGVRRRKTYAVQSIVGNVAEALWHKIRKEDGLE